MALVEYREGVRTLSQEFENLFREHHQFVFRTAYSVTGNEHDADDVAQTIFLRILRGEFPLALRNNPKGYLYRAAVNVSLSTIRSRRRSEELTKEPLEMPPSLIKPPVTDENRKRLLDAMARLSPRAVEILVLRYEHDYSDAQIAALLRTSRGAIAISLFRSRARLRKLLRRATEGGR